MEKKDIIQKLKESREDSLNAIHIIENMPEDLKNELMTSKNSIMELVKAHGVVTGYLPEESISQEIILEAIKTYPKALVLAVNEKDDFNNKEFMEEVIKTNPYAILSIKSGWEQTKKLGLVSDLNAELSNKMIEEIIKQFKFKDVSNENPIEEWQKEEEYIQSFIVGTIDRKAGRNLKYSSEMIDLLKSRVKKDINNPEKLNKIHKLMIPYNQIAKEALMSWNGLTQDEANKEVAESSFEELESQVYAQGSINYAIRGLQDKINLSEEQIERYRDAIFDGPITSNIFDIVKNKIDEIDNNNDIALDVLSSIHDGWVKDNQKKFFAREKKHQHMPLELIGWEEAKADLLFLRPILEATRIEVNEWNLEKAYNERVKKFFKDKQITNKEDLISEISKGAEFYPALDGQEDILNAISDKDFIDESLIPQIEEKGIGNIDRLAKESELQGLQEEDQEKGELLEKGEKLNREQENEGKTVLDE